jgi:hypothetical protein
VQPCSSKIHARLQACKFGIHGSDNIRKYWVSILPTTRGSKRVVYRTVQSRRAD